MNSRLVLFRLSPAEKQQLQQRAEREGETVSELIRDALYVRYGIGSLTSMSGSQPDCNTPQK